MAMIPKARDLQESSLTGGTIRLAQRESFDAKAAIRPPSATGGAPRVKSNVGQESQMSLPEQAPSPPASTRSISPADQYRADLRTPRSDAPILPFLLASRKSIADYNAMAPGFAEQLANDFIRDGIATDGMDANELAQRTVAALHRYADPESQSTGLPDKMYQSRNARQVMRALDQLRARRTLR